MKKATRAVLAMALGLMMCSSEVRAEEKFDLHYEKNVEIICKIAEEHEESLSQEVYMEEYPVYRVQKGDTLSEIAQYFGLSLDKIMEMNPQIEDANLIYINDMIAIDIALPIQ